MKTKTEYEQNTSTQKPLVNTSLSSRGLKDLGVLQGKWIANIYDTLKKYDKTGNVKYYFTLRLATLCHKQDIKYTDVCKCFKEHNLNTELLDEVYLYKTSETRSLGQIFSTLDNEEKISEDIGNNLDKRLKKALSLTILSSDIEAPLGSNSSLVLDEPAGWVKTVRNKQESYNLSVCPVSITEYTDPDDPDFLCFDWTFTNSTCPTSEPFTIENVTLSELSDELLKRGYVITKRNLADTVANAKRAMELKSYQTGYENKYIREKNNRKQGFYLNRNTETIEVVDYQLNDYSLTELKKGINTLLYYADNFFIKTGGASELKQLGTIFKWGLMAPFMFAYKQAHQKATSYYLYGASGAGKTKQYCGMIGHLWFDTLKDGEFWKSSDSVSTPYRLGITLNESTFPVDCDEAENLFGENKSQLKDMLKNASDNLYLREIYGKSYKALSMPIFTANGSFTDTSGGLSTRYHKIFFTRTQSKNRAELDEKFKKEFPIGDEKCRLNELRPIAHKFAQLMCEVGKADEYLHSDWKTITDIHLKTIFDSVNMELPEWLSEWYEHGDETEESYLEEKEAVCDAIKNMILAQIPIDTKVTGNVIIDTIKMGRIPSLFYKKGTDTVNIRSHLLSSLYKNKTIEHKMSLNNFAKNYEDYGFEYKTVKTETKKNKAVKVVQIRASDFIDFVYEEEFDGEDRYTPPLQEELNELKE